MKSKVCKLDIGKLETTTVYWGELSDAVKAGLVKKTEYKELVKKG